MQRSQRCLKPLTAVQSGATAGAGSESSSGVFGERRCNVPHCVDKVT